MDDLIRKWLWMQTMNYALEQLKREVQWFLYPKDKYHEWKWISWEDMQKILFTYILDNWPISISCRGSGSGHSRYDIGYDLSADSKGVTGEYKNMTVEIKWPEVRRFIQKMLSPDMEDRQMNLLDLLAEVSHEKSI